MASPRLAVRLASAFDGPVVVVATAEARDDEMLDRIRAHRSTRPAEWVTAEAPLHPLAAVEGIDEKAMCDPRLPHALGVQRARGRRVGGDAIDGEARTLASILAGRDAPSVVVSNEVGLGIVPANELARRYRDVLGRVNGSFADEASRSFLVVAGRGLPLQEVTPS